MSLASIFRAQFDFHTRLFNNVISGVTDAESNERPSGRINNMKWIAGHMLNTRINSIMKVVGGEPDTAYAGQFARGAVLQADAVYPAIEEISARWNSTASAISERLGRLPDEMLTAQSALQSPIYDIDNTFAGFLSFLLSHEALHIGQLSLLRKMNEKEAMEFR